MKVICSKESLLKGLVTVSRAVPVRTTLEILKCVLLQAEGQKLKLTANDTSLGIETNISAVVEEPGTVAIDASLITAIIRKLPDSDIVISSDHENGVMISCENAKFNIAGRGSEDFVYLPDVDVNATVSISQFTLREMIGQVIFSIADSEVNAAMAGVYIEVFDGKIRMTTLDGHRISVRVNELKENFEKISAIIPGKTLNDLSKIISGDSDKNMTVCFSKNHITFIYDDTLVVSRVIEGDYFKVESMLREEHETHVHLNKRVFLDCLDRSTLFINESDKKPVVIDIKDEIMSLRLKSAIGSMNEAIPITKAGKDIKIAFNPKLLIDALRVIDDEEIDLYLVKYNYPCTIRDHEKTYSYVILPVNFTED